MSRLIFVCFAALLLRAQDPLVPHSAFEPPAAKAAASLAASTKASPPDLLTTGEKTDWNQTAPYAEAVDISHRLERASRFVKVLKSAPPRRAAADRAVVVARTAPSRPKPPRKPAR